MGSMVNRFDDGITGSVQGWPAWVHPFMNAASLVGEPVVVVSLALASALIANHHGREQMAWAFVVTVMAAGVDAILKQFLNRTRPDTLYVTAMKFKSYSFPSAHAFGSLVTFGLIAYLATKYLIYPWDWVIVVCLAGLVLLVGASRVYLGAHYPTDVLGGWIFGGIVLLVILQYIHV